MPQTVIYQLSDKYQQEAAHLYLQGVFVENHIHIDKQKKSITLFFCTLNFRKRKNQGKGTTMSEPVVVSEFSVRLGNTQKGSRGSTFSNYVLDYMSREHATEDLGPVGLFAVDTLEYESYYESRLERDLELRSRRKTAKNEKQTSQERKEEENHHMNGVAFDQNNVTLNALQIRSKAARLQKDFLQRKTIFKTVISFDEEFLKENGLSQSNIEINRKGDWMNQADHLRLRLGIQKALREFASGYDDLNWIGVIQADTRHIHCHLCMADEGIGTLIFNGEQKGKIPQKRLSSLRRNLDRVFTEQRFMLPFVNKGDPYRIALQTREKRHEEIQKRNAAALMKIDAFLPDNLSCEDTQKVREVISEWIADYEHYKSADFQSKQTDRLLNELMENRKKKLFNEENLMMPVQETVFRPEGFVRKYKRRCASACRHQIKAQECSSWIDSLKTVNPGPLVSTLIRYLEIKEDLHRRICEKNRQKTLSRLKRSQNRNLQELARMQDHLSRLQQMIEDPTFVSETMTPALAAVYGKETYGLGGGDFFITAPGFNESRYEILSVRYEKIRHSLEDDLSFFGYSLTDDLQIERHSFYTREQLQDIDLHEQPGTHSKGAIRNFRNVWSAAVSLFKELKQRLPQSPFKKKLLDEEEMEAVSQLMQNEAPVFETEPEYRPLQPAAGTSMTRHEAMRLLGELTDIETNQPFREPASEMQNEME